MIRDDEFSSVMTAYRNGFTADFLQAKYSEKWTTYWTIPSCSPAGLEKAGRQFTFSRAQALRHFRRANLTRQGVESRRVMICTEMPTMKQAVYCLDSFRHIPFKRFLSDEALQALTESFIPYGARVEKGETG